MTPEELRDQERRLAPDPVPSEWLKLEQLLAKHNPKSAAKHFKRLLEEIAERVDNIMYFREEVAGQPAAVEYAVDALKAVKQAQDRLQRLKRAAWGDWECYLITTASRAGRPRIEDAAAHLAPLVDALTAFREDHRRPPGRPPLTAGRTLFERCGRIWVEATGRGMPPNKNEEPELYRLIVLIAADMSNHDKGVMEQLSDRTYKFARDKLRKGTKPKKEK